VRREKGRIAKEMDEDVEESHRKKKSFMQIRRRVRSGMRLGKAGDKYNQITTQRSVPLHDEDR